MKYGKKISTSFFSATINCTKTNLKTFSLKLLKNEFVSKTFEEMFFSEREKFRQSFTSQSLTAN